jgi:hypothetical protein
MEQELSIFGIIFLSIVWSMVISIVTFTMYKVLTIKPNSNKNVSKQVSDG